LQTEAAGEAPEQPEQYLPTPVGRLGRVLDGRLSASTQPTLLQKLQYLTKMWFYLDNNKC